MLGLPYRLPEIAALCMAKDLFQGQYEPGILKYVSFDTRAISHGPETVFVAIQTANRDGHDFIPAAIERGVRNFIVEKKLNQPGINYLLADNSLDCLQLWAMRHRMKFTYPVLAITGSNGKTTVKEWLASLLEMQFQIVKSPMSYNSQLGVALSLLQMYPQADLAIIEAGISQKGEMEILKEMIQPTLGILCHMGPAHAENFSSDTEKLQEKCKLFEAVEHLIVGPAQEGLLEGIGQFPLINTESYPEIKTLKPPFKSPADLENAQLAVLSARQLGMSLSDIQDRLSLLHPVQMRQEILTDNPEITLINDSYNSDPDSVRNAFQLLKNIQSHTHKYLIMTDIPHLGALQKEIQNDLLKEGIDLFGKENVCTIGPVFHSLHLGPSYVDMKGFLAQFRYNDFVDHTILLKGSRQYQLEQLIPLLHQQLHATELQIDLHALTQNYRTLKQTLPTGTKTMCMVKADSYGGGTWEIAQVLEREGADYLGVAYTAEGIALRQAGIRLPIMVMNPEPASIEAILQYELEPEVHNLDFLNRYVRSARLAGKKDYKIHLKLETGMGRLGFKEDELAELVEQISLYPDLIVCSVLSHLAAADMESEDAFSLEQIRCFERMYQYLQQELGIHAMRHILNTAGILRFSSYSWEMVRMGIGLYGLNPLPNHPIQLTEIGSLRSTISQIKSYPAGISIGYGRAQRTQRPSRIATIPIGYADGIPRALSNGKFSFLVRGKAAPIFGRVCMDMLMLDVTDIPEALAGDPVVIFGQQGSEKRSVHDLASAADTIAYEILVRISPRVRRVYVWQD